MPWALPGQAVGLESWAGRAEAEGDSGHLRMVNQGIPGPMSDQCVQGTTGHNFLSFVANRHELKGKLKPFEGHPVWRVFVVTTAPLVLVLVPPLTNLKYLLQWTLLALVFLDRALAKWPLF